MANNPNEMNDTKLPNEAQIVYGGKYYVGPHSPSGLFSEEVHDNLLRHKGFKAIHYRHALNPNRTTPAEGVKLDQADLSAYNYYDPQEFYMVPQNIRWEDLLLLQNLHGKNTVTVNYTSKYEDTGTRSYLRKGDIIIGKDTSFATVLVEELIEFKPGLATKMKFPVFNVDYCANESMRFELNSDFIVEDGLIYWIGRTPTFDASRNRGDVISVVYWTFPYFVVIDTPRIFRTVWANTFADTSEPAKATYLPGSAVLLMSWLQPQLIVNNIVWPGFKI
jgi:hypothetical protein